MVRNDREGGACDPGTPSLETTVYLIFHHVFEVSCPPIDCHTPVYLYVKLLYLVRAHSAVQSVLTTFHSHQVLKLEARSLNRRAVPSRLVREIKD